MRVDDIQGHHIKSRRAAGSSTAMGTPVADPGVRPAIRRFTDRYPALCLLALTLAGHTAVRVTKGGLQSIKREISRALRDAKEADDARR